MSFQAGDFVRVTPHFRVRPAYCLLVHIHNMISDTEEGKNPFDALVSDLSSFFRCWVIDLTNLREELVRFIGVLRWHYWHTDDIDR